MSGAIAGCSARLPESAIDPIAFASILALEEFEPGVVREIVSDFRQSAAQKIATIRGAIGTGDARALEFEAHSLKGNSATLGASRVAAVASLLEVLGREGRVTEAAELAALLGDELCAFGRALDSQPLPL
jgi:HPt (histidine-containing phosphotransfer) domain-containing protein